MTPEIYRFLHIAFAYAIAGGGVLIMALHLTLEYRRLRCELVELGASDRERES